jgi:tRNA/rRNA methyltransferase
MFHRMELTQQDVRTWWGMVVRLVEGPRVKVQTRKRQKQNKADRGPASPREDAS